jgi:hypothetical protein
MGISAWNAGIIRPVPVAPTGPFQNGRAPGVWTLDQAAYWTKQGLWPIAGNAAPSQEAYTTPGTYSWVAPAGVTSVSVVAVGAGKGTTASGSGPGGSLSYKNNISVTPGQSYTVVVGNTGTGLVLAGSSSFVNSSTLNAPGGGNGESRVGDGGGSGGSGGSYANDFGAGGGGAGGYSGNGGNGGFKVTNQETFIAATDGAGGGGGGGGLGGDGGGVGLLGAGASGTGGSSGQPGQPGSGGSGVSYGGGAGGNPGQTVNGGGGAVRIIWPGTTRQFPSTNTGDL